MSLLMKALEKAAKDRGDAQPQAKAPGAVPAELSLEPVGETPLPAAAPATAVGVTDPGVGKVRQPASQPRSSAAADQARAATVIKATERSSAAAVAGTSNRPRTLIVFGVLAGLVAIGFGIYVYLQITNPAMFLPKPPAPGPIVQAPPTTPPAPPAQGQVAVSTASVVQAGTPESGPAPAAPAAGPTGTTAATPTAPPSAATTAAAAPETSANRISVSRGSAEPKLNPLLADAYAALESGRLDVARNQYEQLLKAEPRSIDALLGLAAIAVQDRRPDDASKLYLRILDLDPRHALAQAGLIALLGRADPLAAESRLKQLIARDPAPYLHFTLGNLYADQAQWAQAQQAYFQAHHLEPGNPDYAYNLAVGLEHVGQPKLALGFYRRAVQLAAARGQANFNVPQTQERISRLAAQVE